MANRTGISYLTRTWNVTSGRSPVGDGCDHCWAANWHKRFRGGDFSVKMYPEKLGDPFRWRKPRIVGVSFMGDLFHDQVPDEYIFRVCDTIANAPHHHYLLLTKRWERMARMVQPMLRHLRANGDPVWWGFTAWDNDSAKAVAKIAESCFLQSDHVWLSLEPLLGPVDLGADIGFFNWVVASCESGANRRPARGEWFDDIRAECKQAGVPFYLKQAAGKIGGSTDGAGKVIHHSPPTERNLPPEIWRVLKGKE